MKRWRRRRRGGAYAEFEQYEARLLANLAAQVAELVRDEQPAPVVSDDPLEALVDLDGSLQPPDDPVLQRLLPDAYRDDLAAASDFRRFTEQGLRAGKVRNAETVIAALAAGGLAEDDQDPAARPAADVEVDLDAEQVQAWLRTLTDIRLSLATRLGITEDDPPRPDPGEGEARAVMRDVYDWLAFVQETLVLTVS